jgi:hypothetical protein
MPMSLSDIEAKAENIAESLLIAGKNEAELLGIHLQGLRDLAQIKEAKAFGAASETEERPVPKACPSTFQLSKDEYYVCVLPFEHAGQHRGGGMWWAGPGNGGEKAEPIKPAIDRLHELLSYLISHSNSEFHQSNKHAPDSAESIKHLAASKAYDDGAQKLQEILNEGGI